MSKIVVASMNPTKIRAALLGFQAMFVDTSVELVTVSVPSGVSAQPLSDADTLLGATQRVRAARMVYPQADYWFGIEGGVEVIADEMIAFAWVVVQAASSPALLGRGKTGCFFLPAEVTALVKAGKELGEADDLVFQRVNSKQEDGAVGLLTGQIIDRTELYKNAVILALIPFKNPTLYTPRREDDLYVR